MTYAISNTSTLEYIAKWNPDNAHLAHTFCSSILKTFTYFLHKAAMLPLLPASFISRETCRHATAKFREGWQKAGCVVHPLEITTPDGVKLKGHLVQSPNVPKSGPLVIYFQPNGATSAATSGEGLLRHAISEKIPVNFLFFDYRGVGDSEGTATSTQQLILDGESVLQFAKDKLKAKPEEIRFYGHSLGGAIAAKVLEMHPECTGPAVLDRTFAALPDVMQEIAKRGGLMGVIGHAGQTIIRWLGWDLLNIRSSLEKLKSKTLVIYHPQDDLIRGRARLAEYLPPHVKTMQLGHQRWYIDVDFDGYCRLKRSGQQKKDRVYNAHGADVSLFATDTKALAKEEIAQFLLGYSETSDADWLRRFTVANNTSSQAKVYKAVAKLFQGGGYYATSGEDAFHNRNGLTLTDKERAKAIRHVWMRDFP